MLVKPMLAPNKNTDVKDLVFPYFVSPKYDGVRAIIDSGVVLSRNRKPIPNRHIQDILKTYHGLDGELIVGDPTEPEVYRGTQSGVMSEEGVPDFTYFVFDYWDYPNQIFDHRNSNLGDIIRINHSHRSMPIQIQKVRQHYVTCLEELEVIEENYVTEGYEGVMLRRPDSVYKYGRATPRENSLLKLKRFNDIEVTIVGYKERMHNDNPSFYNELGYEDRSTSKEHMIPTGMLGSFICEYPLFTNTFGVGTGIDDALRVELWHKRRDLLGKKIKIKYQQHGSTAEAPRIPVFLGFRHEIDE